MYDITLNNPGGVLDARTAQTPEQAAAEAIRMIEEAGALHDGDTIVVTEVED